MMKILHIVGGLNVGGIENWLLKILKENSSNDVRQFVYVSTNTRLNLLHDFSLYAEVIYSDSTSFYNNVKKYTTLIRKEKFDIIHSHTDVSSGYYSLINYCLKTGSKFITHSHTDRRFTPKQSVFKCVYINLMKFCIKLFSNKNIAVSDYAGRSLFHSNTYEVIYCGVSKHKVNYQIKDELLENIKDDKRKKIMHVARFNEAKNHEFIITLASKTQDSNIYILMGEGEKFSKIKDLANELNVTNVIFLGMVDDVQSYVKLYADLVILPSLWEGLPLSIIEAQIIGVPCLVSDNVTKECDIGNVQFVELDLDKWIYKLRTSSSQHSHCEPGEFTIEKNVYKVNHIYNQLLGRYNV